MLLALVESSLSGIILAAKNVPPIDTISLAFNIWFGLVTVIVVNLMKGLLFDIFFSEIIRARMTAPLITSTTKKPDGSLMHNSIYHNKALDFLTKQSEPTTSGVEPIQTQSHCPGTPDSQADTEPETRVKSTNELIVE